MFTRSLAGGLLLAFLLALWADLADARTLKSGKVTITLSDAACASSVALSAIRPEYRDRFHDGDAKGPDFAFRFCWTNVGTDGSSLGSHIYVIGEDGAAGLVDLSEYSVDPGT